MSFSVVGLPHYTIWHLYEPSYEDIRHMEELEQERAKQEEAERQRRERADRIQEDKSLPPLKISLTKLTYNAVDRAQWRRHGKVTWAGAMKDAAIEGIFCDVQEHERLKVREGLR